MLAPMAVRVVLLSSDAHRRLCDLHTKIPGRSSAVFGLAKACGLICHLRVVKPPTASVKELLEFHSKKYLSALKYASAQQSCTDREQKGSPDKILQRVLEDFGLTHDCCLFPSAWEYSRAVAGASLWGAKMLIEDSAGTVIHWEGGRHHAKPAEASGFCYINDVVLALLLLSQRFKRVMYIDIDLHHGDAVEKAFYSSRRVMTISFHKYEQLFYPGTGAVSDCGSGAGKYFSLNVALRHGVYHAQFCKLFDTIIGAALEAYQPQAIVMVAGADGLGSDPMMGWNLKPESFSHCVTTVQRVGVPLLLLGGGGYSTPDTARAWVAATAASVEVSRSGTFNNSLLPENVPSHDYFSLYGPTFTMSGRIAGAKEIKGRNENSEEFIEQLTVRLLRFIKRARKRLAKDALRSTSTTNTRVRKRGVPEGGEDGSSESPKRTKNPETNYECGCDSDSKRDTESRDYDSNPKSVTDNKLSDVNATVPTCSLQKVMVSKETQN